MKGPGEIIRNAIPAVALIAGISSMNSDSGGINAHKAKPAASARQNPNVNNGECIDDNECTEPSQSVSPLLGKTMQSQEKPNVLSLEEIMASINCQTVTIYSSENGSHEISDHQLLELLKCSEIEKVEIQVENDYEIKFNIYLKNGETVARKVLTSFGNDLHKYLLNKGLDIRNIKVFAFTDILMLIAMIGLLIVMIGGLIQVKGLRQNIAGRNKAKTKELPDIKFDDIAGLRNVKRDLVKLVEEIKGRKTILEIGGKIPKGILFVGPPGSGKTLAARAIATESDISFIDAAGSEFSSKYVGETSKAIRDLFARARKKAKEEGACIIFIDEIDALGTKRITNEDHSTAVEHNAIVNQLLTEMDGFKSDDGIMVIAATNHPEVLDTALTRSGRFDREVIFSYPDQEGRLELLKILTKDIDMEDDVRLETIASTLVGRSGADLENVIEEAKLLALQRGTPVKLTQKDLTSALDRALMGMESDQQLSPVEQERVAIHEAGHTVMSLLNPGTTVERVTIIPRGRSLGVTLTPPLEERQILTATDLKWTIKLLLAGKVAEILKFGEGSTGAADDLRKSTELATQMVLEHGLFPAKDRTTSEFRTHNRKQEDISRILDSYIDQILNNCGAEVKKALTQNRALLEAIAEKLIKDRTIEHAELIKLFAELGQK